ncbi:hypothetical protein, partial [Siminovitchia fortis]|uniref:hypothetical protein n=2 Tax=Siminovitchia fortis TaxID=254758 RepID=UPI001C98B048
FFSARLMLVADKQALSAFPYPLSRRGHSSLYVDGQGACAFLYPPLIFKAFRFNIGLKTCLKLSTMGNKGLNI